MQPWVIYEPPKSQMLERKIHMLMGFRFRRDSNALEWDQDRLTSPIFTNSTALGENHLYYIATESINLVGSSLKDSQISSSHNHLTLATYTNLHIDINIESYQL